MSTAVDPTRTLNSSNPSTLALVGMREVNSPGSSTLLYNARRNLWMDDLLREIISKSSDPNVSRDDAQACLGWIQTAPVGAPRPFFAVGDDGSLGFEWDRGDNHLFILFAKGNADVYFEGASGEEWESSLRSAYGKLDSAFRAISGI